VVKCRFFFYPKFPSCLSCSSWIFSFSFLCVLCGSVFPLRRRGRKGDLITLFPHLCLWFQGLLFFSFVRAIRGPIFFCLSLCLRAFVVKRDLGRPNGFAPIGSAIVCANLRNLRITALRFFYSCNSAFIRVLRVPLSFSFWLWPCRAAPPMANMLFFLFVRVIRGSIFFFCLSLRPLRLCGSKEDSSPAAQNDMRTTICVNLCHLRITDL
jgi:hypothetical protein